MNKRQTRRSEFKKHTSHSIEYLWCWRMLVACKGFLNYRNELSLHFSNETMDFIGLSSDKDGDCMFPAVSARLRRMYAAAEMHDYRYPEDIYNNASLLLKSVTLNKVEFDLLMLSILLHDSRRLKEISSLLEIMNTMKLINHLSVVLGHDRREISRALATKGILARSGLLKLDRGEYGLDNKLDLFEGLADIVCAPIENEQDLFSCIFRTSNPPKLGENDFSYIGRSYEILRSYISAVAGREEGVNVLIYGLPGTGKTELVRALAHNAGTTLYEISIEDVDGEPLSGKQRFSSFQLSQHLLRDNSRAVILFDEIEDIFPDPFSFTEEFQRKAWINHALESNHVPAFWLCNNISNIDKAFIRRFDYVMEMPSPPSQVREKMISRYMTDIQIDARWARRMAENKHMLPAHIERASKVVMRLKSENASDNEMLIENILKGTMKALDRTVSFPRVSNEIEFDPEFISADLDIGDLISGLKKSGRGNFCFYGPPGTGKTALGKYIANKLSKPLIIKRASDILDMWLGGTERNIADMFDEATSEDAVLLLDEADSFLRDRRGATRSWEVTQVNEMLAQMDGFEGIFICSTNLMDDFDQASIRRFPIKVGFDYLSDHQALELLRRMCGMDVNDLEIKALKALTYLTPGDFAAVAKRLNILGEELQPSAFIRGLDRECDSKKSDLRNNFSRRIGFIN